MKTYLLNPTLQGKTQFIREGRCMQKASSWATIWPPLTLAVLGAIAREYGDVKLLDGNVESMPLEELLADLAVFSPDLLVINTGFPSIDNDMDVARHIKERMPAVKIFATGVFFTLLEEKALVSYPFLDFAAIGEPEDTFRELLGSLESGCVDLSTIRGLGFFCNGDVQINEPRPLIENLDSLPYPARDLLKNDRYRLPHNNKAFTLINSARGCPYHCIYCIVGPYYGKKIRRHSVSYLVEEVRECNSRYGITEFLFWEEIFGFDKRFVAELCDALIENGLDIHWAATSRVDTIDEATLQKMKAAGCYLLGLGIESGCQELLDAAKKNQTVEQIVRAVEMCKKVGLQTMGHFIFGLPGETAATAERTIAFMKALGLDFMQAYCAVPYPKTEFGAMAREHGWVTTDTWSQFDFGGRSIVTTDSMSADEVTRYRQMTYRSFYFRPLYILNTLKKISFSQISRLRGFWGWIRNR